MANGKSTNGKYTDRLEYMKGIMEIEKAATDQYKIDKDPVALAKKNAKLAHTETLMTIEKVADGSNGEKIVPVLVTYGDQSSRTMAGVVYAGVVINKAVEKDNFDTMENIIYTMMGVKPVRESEKKDAPVKIKQVKAEGENAGEKKGFVYMPAEDLKKYNRFIEETSELAKKAGVEYKPKMAPISIPEGAGFVYMPVEAAALYKEAVEHAAGVTKQINEAQNKTPEIKTEVIEASKSTPVLTEDKIQKWIDGRTYDQSYKNK